MQININPEQPDVKDVEPMRTLSKYRLPAQADHDLIVNPKYLNKPVVGLDVIIIKIGTISVGDDIILIPN